jgi:acyl-CoA synthetase (AMP-forming)/AMP-acid ligase II
MVHRYTLPDYLESTAACRADAIALIEGDRRVSYSELRALVLREAGRLRQNGVERGGRVVILLPNSIDFVVAFWAIQYLGAVAVPLNPDVRASKLRWIVQDCSPSAVIVNRCFGRPVGTHRSGSGMHHLYTGFHGNGERGDAQPSKHGGGLVGSC